MTEWISVTEQLPDIGVSVLLFIPGYNPPGAPMQDEDRYEVLHLKEYDVFVRGVGRKEFAWYPGGRPVGSSSHWMPLPPVPES